MRVSDTRVFLLVLLCLGLVLTAAVIPGIFTVDENNYLVNVLALRHGHVTVTNTAGLSPSRELLFFDPRDLFGKRLLAREPLRDGLQAPVVEDDAGPVIR